MSDERFLLAGTSNKGKLSEIKALLQPLSLVVLSPGDFPHLTAPEETGKTFQENALLKARYYHQATGLPTLAEDSGLEVEALGGRPGVYSARFAGADASDTANIEALLSLMTGKENRNARFRTVLVLITRSGSEHVFEGEARGRIAREPLGTGGFGYDAVFIPEGHERSFAQMTPEKKNAISHRRRALEKALPFIAGSF